MKNEVIPTTGRDNQPICIKDERNDRMKKGGVKIFAKTLMQNIASSPVKQHKLKNILPVFAVKPIIWLPQCIFDYIDDPEMSETRSL